MQIERIEVVGFGCLARHEHHFEPGRINLILAPNEAGKSTLLAAIETVLFGFPSARTQEGRDLRQCYRPWSGGRSRVVLHLGNRNHRYRIEYDFLDAAGNAVDQLTVYRDHKDVTDEMRGQARCPGEWLLNLSRDDFRRSVLVRQGELESISSDTGRLIRHLESIVTSTEAGASASAAQGRLESALDDYRVLASLQRWSPSYLAHAKQWSRVEPKLEQAVEDYEREKHELHDRREKLAGQIAEFEKNKDLLETMTKTCDCLRVLERGVRKRELQDSLDKDEQLSLQIAALTAKLGTYDDVKAFPAEREKELGPLIERETQLRKQREELGVNQKRSEEQIQENERQRTQLASAAVLAGQDEQLHEQLTLLAQSMNDEKAWRDRQSQAHKELESEGHPLKRLQQSRAHYKVLTEKEREHIRDFELELAAINQQRQDAETARGEAQRQLDQISERRRARRRLGAASLLTALAAGGAAIFWGIGSGVGLILLAVMLALLAASVMLILGSRQLDAYRYDQLHDEIRKAQESSERLDEDERRLRDQLEKLATSAGLTGDELIDAVKFYLSHHEKLEDCDRIESRCQEARDQMRAFQRRWAEWLRDAGQDVPIDNVTVEMAEALVQKVDRFNSLTAQRSSLGRRRDELAEQEGRIRTAGREVQEQIASLMTEANVDLVLPGNPHELIGAQELVAARREFERLAKRAAERQEVVRRQESLRQQPLPGPQRTDLQGRIDRIEQETQKLAARTCSPHEALAWLQSIDEDGSGPKGYADWWFDTLASEQVARAREQCHNDLEGLRSEQTSTWQQVRGFLKDYVARMKHIEGELQCLKAELWRAQRFAEAVTIASETLRNVQSNSYERWSSLLSNHLEPLLAAFLPDYRLEGIAADLAPVLIHGESGQRLDLAGIRLHLSRGAKDRLFLAMRLALAEALGQERNVRLPLLLDDPLANWDDEALTHGMRILAGLGSREASLIVFSCQRSRFEWLTHTAGDLDAAISARDFR